MENRSLNRLKEIVVVNIKNKNIDRALRKIYAINIVILDTEYLSRKEVNIKIFLKDYNKLKRSIIVDSIDIINEYGALKVKNILRKNKIFIISIIFGYIFLYALSNVVFSIDIIHSNSKLRSFLSEELNKRGMKVLSIKKSFDEITKIKEDILNSNKNILEWLEIETIGTKYIIKFEERKILDKNEEYIYQDIVSSRSAIIKKIVAENGVIMKKANDYVKKGDIIISGKIYKNNEIVNIVKASGKIYGEVWYNVKVEYPTIINVKEETGDNKKFYAINILGYSLPIFDFNPYKYKTIVNDKIFYDRLLGFNFSLQTHYEQSIISGIYSIGEALIEAEKYANNKMKSTLKEDEYIIMNRVVNYNVQDNKIYIEIFYKVYKNITDTIEIVKE